MLTNNQVLQRIFPNGTLNGDFISISLSDVPLDLTWGTYVSSDIPNTFFYLIEQQDALVAVGAIQETEHLAMVRIFKIASGHEDYDKLYDQFQYSGMFDRIWSSALCFKQAKLEEARLASETNPSEHLAF